MGELFYKEEFRGVLSRILTENTSTNQIMDCLPQGRERIFPQTDIAAIEIRGDAIQWHNFRFWALSLLDRLGFVCENPALGYYRLRVEPVPEFLNPQLCPNPSDFEGSFILLRRLLQSMTLLGLGHHAKQVYNIMMWLMYVRRLGPTQQTMFKTFTTWCTTTLMPHFVASTEIHPPEETASMPEPTPGSALREFEYQVTRDSKEWATLVSCEHDIIARPFKTSDNRRMLICPVVGTGACPLNVEVAVRTED